MPSLREMQIDFAAALAGLPASGRVALAADGLAIYRANGRANYRNALGATFPVIRRLTGTPFFNAAVDAFVAAHPPVASDLNVYGGGFASFLQRYEPAVELPYLAGVAQLEWGIDEANRAADCARVPDAVLAALSIVAPGQLPEVHLVLAASCRLTASSFPILRIWRVNQTDRSGHERVDLAEGATRLLVRRDPDGVALETLSAGEHAWLAAFARGATFGAAIDAAFAVESSFDLGTALRAHIESGTIVAVAER